MLVRFLWTAGWQSSISSRHSHSTRNGRRDSTKIHSSILCPSGEVEGVDNFCFVVSTKKKSERIIHVVAIRFQRHDHTLELCVSLSMLLFIEITSTNDWKKLLSLSESYDWQKHHVTFHFLLRPPPDVVVAKVTFDIRNNSIDLFFLLCVTDRKRLFTFRTTQLTFSVFDVMNDRYKTWR